MGELIKQFDADNAEVVASFNGAVAIGAVFLVLCLAALFFKSVVKKQQYRVLLAMLFFFFGLTAFGKAYFTRLTTGKIGPVSLYTQGISTPNGDVALADIKDAFIYTDQQKSLINPNIVQKTARTLCIEKNDGERIFLQERFYPIEAIFAELREQVKQAD